MPQARKRDPQMVIYLLGALTFIAIALIMGFVPGEHAVHGLAWMGFAIAVILAGMSVLGGVLFYISNRTFDRRKGLHL